MFYVKSKVDKELYVETSRLGETFFRSILLQNHVVSGETLSLRVPRGQQDRESVNSVWRSVHSVFKSLLRTGVGT